MDLSNKGLSIEISMGAEPETQYKNMYCPKKAAAPLPGYPLQVIRKKQITNNHELITG
jgi:hypothetical protein